MFHIRGAMPDEVSRQCPEDLFRLLDMLNEENEPMAPEDVPQEWKFFYGL